MDDALLPWMLKADWRGDDRALLVVDLDTWPEDVALSPLPPVPVIAIGRAGHPQARHADVLVEEGGVTLAQIVTGIATAPRAAATLVQLLRSLEGVDPVRALPLESFAFAMLQGSAEHAGWLAGRTVPAPQPAGSLRVERAGDELRLHIDRPHARNAIDRAMRDALHDAFALAALDESIRHITLSGEGRCFSMGADLAEFGTTRCPVEAHAIRMTTLPALPLVRRAARFSVHIQGGCVGSGLELAAFADAVTASADAWFQLPEVAMGIIPGFGGCVSIPARIGRPRAAALMLSGRRITARLAHRWGLVDRLV